MEIYSNFVFRKVTKDDRDILFHWANDEEVRKNSFQPNLIKYDEHIEWFNKKINSEDSQMYIIEIEKVAIGIIRLDKIENYFYINYSISKEHRGKGYASVILKLLKDKYKDNVLLGKVKSTNIASIKAFKKAGYLIESTSSNEEIIVFSTNNF